MLRHLPHYHVGPSGTDLHPPNRHSRSIVNLHRWWPAGEGVTIAIFHREHRTNPHSNYSSYFGVFFFLLAHRLLHLPPSPIRRQRSTLLLPSNLWALVWPQQSPQALRIPRIPLAISCLCERSFLSPPLTKLCTASICNMWPSISRLYAGKNRTVRLRFWSLIIVYPDDVRALELRICERHASKGRKGIQRGGAGATTRVTSLLVKSEEKL